MSRVFSRARDEAFVSRTMRSTDADVFASGWHDAARRPKNDRDSVDDGDISTSQLLRVRPSGRECDRRIACTVSKRVGRAWRLECWALAAALTASDLISP